MDQSEKVWTFSRVELIKSWINLHYCKQMFDCVLCTTKHLCIKTNLPTFQDSISQLKSKMASNAKECDERNRLIKEVRYIIT